ncbi:MAG: RDD family protein [Deltaproteobacteria bacterium]|nr:RDD family protein [Deltaproteobacteria bacterium]MDQ3297377.1 RDD family protein [Myxococcota bacterium]
MSETEPSLLRDQADGPGVQAATDGDATVKNSATPAFTAAAEPVLRPSARAASTVHVVGFWRRAVAALVDLAVLIPCALLITLIVSKIAGVHLPPSNLRLLDLDLWIDLALATDPALVMGFGLFVAIGLTYLLVFHIVLGHTLGMRLLKIRIIDVYGDRPSPARCAARCAGYLAGVATLFLGFLWIAFDSEKRGLQDWIAGTYVIRA